MQGKTDLDRIGLLNKDFIASHILKDAPWAESHGTGADEGFLGAGLLYYSLAYMLRAELCVCIGSGGGFVPRLMRQAQRDLGLENARTVLIDANIGEWGRPHWKERASFFRTHFADIEIMVDTSAHVFAGKTTKDWKIDYLHIDGDHSHKGSFEDFQKFKQLMSERGIITFHDTKPYDYYNVTCWKTVRDVRESGHRVIDFPWLGSGTALIQLADESCRPSITDRFHQQYLVNFFSTIWRRWNRSIKNIIPMIPKR